MAPDGTAKREQVIDARSEAKRIEDLCDELDRALIHNKAEREYLERLRAKADQTLRQFRREYRLPEL